MLIETNSLSPFYLGTCELFHPDIHGFVEGVSHPEIMNHYLICNLFDKTEFYDEYKQIKEDCQWVNEEYYYRLTSGLFPSRISRHPNLRNYESIVKSNKCSYIVPEIIQKCVLTGEEYVAIKKTFWLRLIQRTWKRIYSEQQQVWNKRKQYSSIKFREINGRWPPDCFYYPTISGMLYQ
jgi:hypothetical protein